MSVNANITITILALVILSLTMCNCTNTNFLKDIIKMNPVYSGIGLSVIVIGLGVYGYFFRNKVFSGVSPEFDKKLNTLKYGMDICYDNMQQTCDSKFPELCEKQFMQCMNGYVKEAGFLRLQ